MFGLAFGSLKSWAYIALAAAFMALAAKGLIFVNEAMDNAAEIVRQQVTIELKDATIHTLQTEKAQIEQALQIVEEERQALNEANRMLRTIRERALTAGDEADGEIAPVLGDTLRALSN